MLDLMGLIRKGIRNPSKIPAFLANQVTTRIRKVRISSHMWYYRLTSDTYTDAYRRLMAYRLQLQGPRGAVGSDDVGIGKLQFEFLRNQGLSPENTLLDIGCGSLRGGQYFIPYLNKNNYTGIDISAEAIEAGKEQIGDNIIKSKRPTFHVNEDLTFKEVSGLYDYALAQSVFTHLPGEHIQECLNHLDKVLDPNGEFYATFFTDPSHSNAKNFTYTESEIEQIARRTGWETKIYSESQFPHPRNQKIVRFSSD